VVSGPEDVETTVRRVSEIASTIKPLLAGHGSEMQGAVLVELVALHLAGHPPQMREHLLLLHMDCVRSLLPAVEREIFGDAGHPGGR
jgi:hypothetical protein